MKQVYEGYAIWRWQDEAERGLVHGRRCFVRAYELSSGRIRVDVDGDGYYTNDRKITFEDDYEFESAFLKVDEKEKARKGKKKPKKGK